MHAWLYILAGFLLTSIALSAQRGGTFTDSRDHPAIRYSQSATNDPIAALSTQLEQDRTRLTFHPDNGYLRSVLDALRIPTESQVTVFSGTSNQAAVITPGNPRALYFNDAVAVGWVRGSEELELAAVDPERGTVFYTLDQRPTDRPLFRRDDETCLTCHLTWDTLGVPGLVVMSVFTIPDDKYSYASGTFSDHRVPFSERWGGWYVTGRASSLRHLGNDTDLARRDRRSSPKMLASLDGLFDMRGFMTRHSDVAALMVLEHQATMTNLITRTGWEARVSGLTTQSRALLPQPPGGSGATDRVRDAVVELVDYMLFVDEAPIVGAIEGSSNFATVFASAGPHDGQGRTLRQLDLHGRLMRNPCSYLIYSDAFEGIPSQARDLVYQRMWRILSGQESGPPYDRLSRDDRTAIVEILLATKKGLPDYFKTP
jgi:hypothetical protein